MFGFGKEKVGFSVLLSMYKASCHTVLRHLLEIWNDVEKLPNIKSNSDINDFAVKNLCQGLLINCLDGTDKTTFFDLSVINDYKNFIEKEENSHIKFETYLDKFDAIGDLMADVSQGRPDLSFLAGVLKIAGIEDNEIEKYVAKLNVSFNMDIILGAITAHQSYIKDKKFVLDEDDVELIEWSKLHTKG
mgnify:CR=1 FL=1|tara:strand:+ start:102 stop:668 length:567 start_codon:yes stop_codon:yes gene_type:complete